MIRRSTRLLFHISILLIPLLSTGNDLSTPDVRVWKDHTGRELSAQFLYLHKGKVGLKLENGREAAIDLETLSATDRDYVYRVNAVRFINLKTSGMPARAGLQKTDLEVSGGPAIYETRWFQFENEEPTSKEFVHEAAQIFEATRRAIEALPLGLSPNPPKGQEKFKARFVTRKRFDQFVNDTPDLSSPDKIAGVYDPKLRSVFVPYDQLGVSKVKGRITLDKSRDSSTLVHEITHQLMHDRLPLTPIWVSEGLAEYMASIPYKDGSFEFQKSEQGLRARLKHRYGSLKATIPTLQDLLETRQNEWRGHTDDYASSLIYTYYFMHLDQPNAQGAPLAAYLHLVDLAKNDTHTLITDYNGEVHNYNDKVVNYNAAILKYREDVTTYQTEVRDYNLKVDKYNKQVTQGVTAEYLIALGPKPTPPQIPIEPKMSALLKTQHFESPIDLYQIANQRARPALLRNRDYASIERELVKKFAALGISISYSKKKADPAYYLNLKSETSSSAAE